MRLPGSADFMKSAHKSPTDATLLDWAFLALLVALGGSSFAMIRAAVETVPPAVVTAGRLWVGAILMVAVMKQANRSLPPLLARQENGFALHHEWRWMIAIATIGYVAPFSIFPWAQQFIDSGLAGVYMAFMPIWTVGLAYLFAGENLNRYKVIGFVLGLIGVVILIGPEALSEAANSSLLAQFAVLIATFCYATNAVLTRRAPPIRPRVFAAGTLLAAAVIATPLMLLTDIKTDEWTLAGVANVIGLGLGPTGLAGILIILMIQRAGAGFMALTNYITPIWAVVVGAVLFGERLGSEALIALAIILTGVAISRRKPRKVESVAAQTNI